MYWVDLLVTCKMLPILSSCKSAFHTNIDGSWETGPRTGKRAPIPFYTGPPQTERHLTFQAISGSFFFLCVFFLVILSLCLVISVHFIFVEKHKEKIVSVKFVFLLTSLIVFCKYNLN